MPAPFANYVLTFAVLARKNVAGMTWSTVGNAPRHAASAQRSALVWPQLSFKFSLVGKPYTVTFALHIAK